MIYFVRSTPDEMKGYQQTTIVTASPLAHFAPETAEGVDAWREDLASGKPPAAWSLANDLAGPDPAPAPKRRVVRMERGYAAHVERLRAAARKRIRLYRMFAEHMDPVPDDIEADYGWRSPNIGLIIGKLTLRDARAAEVTGLTISQYRNILYGMDQLFVRIERGGDPRIIYVRTPTRYLVNELINTYHLGISEIEAAFDCVDLPA